jgi:hypothetical protein
MMGSGRVARVRVVTIIASAEFEVGIEEILGDLGATGYTVVSRVAGRGRHGVREPGLLETGNVRIETLVNEESAGRILRRLADEYGAMNVIAFSYAADAVPAGRFDPPSNEP